MEEKPKKKYKRKTIDKELMSKLGEAWNADKNTVLHEREQCAKIADSFIQPESFDTVTRVVNTVAREIAAKIRDRK